MATLPPNIISDYCSVMRVHELDRTIIRTTTSPKWQCGAARSVSGAPFVCCLLFLYRVLDFNSVLLWLFIFLLFISSSFKNPSLQLFLVFIFFNYFFSAYSGQIWQSNPILSGTPFRFYVAPNSSKHPAHFTLFSG